MNSGKFDRNTYIKEVAAKIRGKQAEMMRGKPDQLAELEGRSDVELVARWAWTAAIVGGIGAFFIAPFVLAILDRLLPSFIFEFLWLLLKLAMLAVIAMFAVAAWLTLKPPSDI